MGILSDIKENLLDYQEHSGVGACVPIAKMLQKQGHGRMMMGQYGKRGDYLESFPHAWIETPSGKIIDPTNPEQGTGEYWDAEPVPEDKLPNPQAYSWDDVAWWQRRTASSKKQQQDWF